MRDAETYKKTRRGVACSRQSRIADRAPWIRNLINTHAVVVGKGTLLEEALSATQTPQTTWTTPLTPETLKLHKNGKFEEDEQTDTSRYPS